MGNRSSVPNHANQLNRDVSRSPAPQGEDHLNPHPICQELVTQNEKVKEETRKSFPEVRILVVGKSGSGKSTLIRVLVGDSGPTSISEGDVGEQDIIKEWRHSDPELPLIIHDSNGIDSKGHSRIDEIRRFLDKRLDDHTSRKELEFKERVHAVWYVFSAMEARVLDDGGLLKMLDSYGERLPLLLIMTNNDYVKRLGEDSVKVNTQVLARLLGQIEDGKKRARLKQSMVRVGNQIKLDKRTGKMLEGSIRDLDGMKLLFERTRKLMHKNLWITWSAGQVVDMKAKLRVSSELIVSTRKKHVWVSMAVSSLPFAQQAELAVTFGSVTAGLVKIWNLPENLEMAINHEFLSNRRWDALKDNLGPNIIGALALGGALAATVLTTGLAAPSLLAVPMVAMSQTGSTSRKIMSYAIFVLGFIIYVHTYEETSNAATSSVEDYMRLCQVFMQSEWAKKLSEFTSSFASVWEAAFSDQRQSERLWKDIVEFFEEITLKRPKSLFSRLENEDCESD